MTTPEKNDPILWIIQADNDGLRQIYETYLPRIRKLIVNKGGTEADVQDVFQDALMVLYEKAQHKDFKLTSSFYTFLYGICRNLWGNRLQKKSFQEVTLPDDIKYTDEPQIIQDLETEEEQNLFWSAFRQLGEDCRRLLQLFFDRTKMEKIAEQMGYSSINYAKKRKFQCKEKLIKLIKEDDRYQELKK